MAIHYLMIWALLALVSRSEVLTQSSLAITIYDCGFAMIKDSRMLILDKGQSIVQFSDVAETIEPQTVMFKPVDSSLRIQIFDQNFQSNLINSHSVLQKRVNQDIELNITQADDSKLMTVKLISSSDQSLMIETIEGISIYNQVTSFSVDKYPQELLTKPTLKWTVYSPQPTNIKCLINYRAQSFGWKAHYIIVLNSKSDTIDLYSWIAIENQSGKSYQNATVKLMGEQISSYQAKKKQVLFGYTNGGSVTSYNLVEDQPIQNCSVFHSYKLRRTVNLNASLNHQEEFMPPIKDLSIKKYILLVLTSGGYEQNLKAQTFIKFLNSKQNKLGFNLPRGNAQIYENSTQNLANQFIGQSLIRHTSYYEEFQASVGNSLNIIAKKEILKKRVLANGGYEALIRMEIINLSNKEHDFLFELKNQERGDLGIVQSNNDHRQIWRKQNANRYTLQYRMGASEEFRLEWTEVAQYG